MLRGPRALKPINSLWKIQPAQPEFNFTQESLNFKQGVQLGLEICINLKILISNHMIGHHAVSLER